MCPLQRSGGQLAKLPFVVCGKLPHVSEIPVDIDVAARADHRQV